MSGTANIQHDYINWPQEPEKRQALAREVFAEHVVGHFDSSVAGAWQAIEEGLNVPYIQLIDADERDWRAWASALPAEDKSRLRAFAKSVIHVTLFGILTDIDGACEPILKGEMVELLSVNVDIYGNGNRHVGEPVERIPIAQPYEELHSEFQSWLDEYSVIESESGGM